MNIALIIAACGILPFPNGTANLERPAHVVAVQANSTEASGTLKLESVVSYVTSADETVFETNVVTKGQSVEKRDAYVGTDIVYYGGTAATAWTKDVKVVTNVVGSVTNVATISEWTLADGASVKGVWTNVATRIRQRYETATATVTNVTTFTRKAYTEHPVTNTVLDAALTGGKYAAVTNLFIPAGKIVGSGTALTNGVIFVFTEE